MKPPLESEVLAACLRYLQASGVFAWRNNNAGVARKDTKGRTWMQFSGIRGASDIFGILPAGGRFLAVEVKRQGEELTMNQEIFLAKIHAAGGMALVVRSVDELIDALKKEMK